MLSLKPSKKVSAKSPKTSPRSKGTSSFADIFPLKSVESNYFVRKDGRYCAIFTVTPVNMSLLEPGEAHLVVEALQEALNASPERLQILVSSERLNLDDYLMYLQQYIEKATESHQVERLESLIGEIKRRSVGNEKVLKFYLVIQSQFEKEAPALSELADLEKQIHDALQRESLYTERLEKYQIMSLFYQKLHPNTSLYEDLPRDATISHLYPSLIDTKTSPFYTILDETYQKSFTIQSFATKASQAGWLTPVFDMPLDLDVSLTLVATDKEEVLKAYNRSIRNIRFSQKDAKRDAAEQKRLERKQEDADYILDLLTNENETLYRVTTLITVRATSLEELRNAEKTLRTRISSKKMSSRPLNRWAFEPIWYSLPLCYKGSLENRVYYNLPAESIASMQPFNSSTLAAKDGFVFGQNEQSHDLVIFGKFEREVYPHMIVLGETGSGKSFFLYYQVLRRLDQGEVVLDLDPERERKSIPGNHIYFGLNHNNTINPFHIRSTVVDSDDEKAESNKAGDYLRLKIGNLLTFFSWIYPDITPIETAALQKAIIQAYADKGLTFDSETLPPEGKNQFPTLSDVIKKLQAIDSTKDMIVAFSPFYGDGIYARMFDGQTNWSFSTTKEVHRGDEVTKVEHVHTYTRLDIRDLYDNKSPALVPLMDLLVHDIWEFVKSTPDITKNIFIDEQHILSDPRNPESLDFIRQMVKRGRKYLSYMVGATQNVGDYLRTSKDLPEPPGKAIITNSGVKLLMRLNKAEIAQISDYVPLSAREKKLLEGGKRPELSRGKGIVIVGGQHAQLQTFMTPAEMRLYRPQQYKLLYESEEGVV
ncbi:VirB4 family type IV secretion system protein (plasmid) [Alicyclobacillus acidoterrestris]|uniref:VirB4 family type IV secretion system protein n=1 Tax=Alicyclobacillus acidoterrestris TaxID=1450 RepID=UPI003F53947B